MTKDGESTAAGKSGPCGRGCKLCGMMRKVGEVEDKNGEKIPIEGDLDCRTKGAVYGIWCDKCVKIVYVGQTKRMVMKRLRDHLHCLKKEDESKPTYHFHRPGHTTEDMGVLVLEGVGEKDEAHRLERKRWWIERLGILEEEKRCYPR